MPKCILKVARAQAGYLVHIEGRGTSRDSPTLAAFVSQCMKAEPEASVTLDLSPCEYLDSTFLGCLLSLHKRCLEEAKTRFLVVADGGARQRLLNATKLDSVLQFADSAPEALGRFVNLAPAKLGESDFGRHVMESHQALAKLPSDHAKLFQQIADKLAQELDDQRRYADRPDSIRETV